MLYFLRLILDVHGLLTGLGNDTGEAFMLGVLYFKLVQLGWGGGAHTMGMVVASSGTS